MDSALADRLRTQMTSALRGDGALASRRWTEAFSSVPRHEFLPRFFAWSDEGWQLVNADSGDEWLQMAYADEPQVTQINADHGAMERVRSGEPIAGTPTSSASAPSLMARMLEALDVTDDSRVLELGTGTGYNTALLCTGLSDGQVASVDIDSHLVEQARAALARLGFRPLLRAADGDSAPLADGAPYDRLIATYGLPSIPQAWLPLLSPGGAIVAPLYRELAAGAMIRLAITDGGQAQGRFLPFYGAFMPTRSRTGPELGAAMTASARGQGTTRSTSLPELRLGYQQEPWLDYAALALGDVHLADVRTDDAGDAEPVQHWLTAPGGSWACQQVRPGQPAVIAQGGPRRLWDELETAHAEWHQMGEPSRERLGLTISPKAQTLWMDEPSRVIRQI